MENDHTITLEANGEFPFEFFIEKAVATDTDADMVIEGVASTTNVDHDKERMSKEALRAMEAAINGKGVPLRVEHNKEGSAIIGTVFQGWVDERNQLHIKARLDPEHPVSPLLHHAIKSGTKMGLSVGGLVKRAVKEFVESVGGYVKTFYDVALNEVSVTPRPANYDSWLIAKSIAKNEADAQRYADSPLRREFLFEHPQCDYLQVFAKSIPDKAWHKVAENMAKTETERETESDETATKAVSRQEFNTLASQVSKGFKAVMGALTKMTTDAVDQRQPTEDKSEEEWDRWSKSESETDEETRTKTEGSAMDQEQPSETKPTDIGESSTKTSRTRKTESESEEETRTKAERESDSETETRTKTREGQETYGTETEGSDTTGERENKSRRTRKTESESEEETRTKAGRSSDSETEIERTIKALCKMSESESETEERKSHRTHKAESESEEETRTKSERESDESETTKTANIDRLTLAIGKAIVSMGERMEKSGTKVYGFEKAIIDALKNDAEFQEDVHKMIKEPGFKKSVSMGHAFVPMKDGSRLQLTLTPVGQAEVKKSIEKGGSFKDVYRTNFSSLSSQEE